MTGWGYIGHHRSLRRVLRISYQRSRPGLPDPYTTTLCITYITKPTYFPPLVSHSSPQLIRIILQVEYRPLRIPLDPVVLDHPVVDPRVLALDRQSRLGHHGIEHKVVIAVRAVLVGLLELLSIFAEALLALLAGEGEVELLAERVRLALSVALGAVEPFPTCGGRCCELGRAQWLGGDGGVGRTAW